MAKVRMLQMMVGPKCDYKAGDIVETTTTEASRWIKLRVAEELDDGKPEIVKSAKKAEKAG